MKDLLVVIVLAVLTTSAHAATLRLYFSTTPLNNGVLDFVPPEYLTQTNPAVAAGTTVYFYATAVNPGQWVSISLNYTGSNGPVALVNIQLQQPPNYRRWNVNSDFTGALNGTNETNLVAVLEMGLPNPHMWDDQDTLAYTGPDAAVHFYLGSVTPTAFGDVFLHVGQSGVSRIGDPNSDPVYFGWGDADIRGNQFGRASDLPDLIITPEPAFPAAFIVAMLFLNHVTRTRK